MGSYSDVIVGHFSGHFNCKWIFNFIICILIHFFYIKDDQLTAVLQNKNDGTYTRVAALGAEEVPMTAEELEIYKVVGVLFNAPSVIPEHNPAIRIYTYETEGNR